MERLTLTAPITPASITGYTLDELSLSRSGERVTGKVLDNLGKETRFSYDGAAAITMMRKFNTENFSVNSMERQVLNRLVMDKILGKGTISGTPE